MEFAGEDGSDICQPFETVVRLAHYPGGIEWFWPGDPLGDGLFYFFDPDNAEMLVKVLDGCDFNGHFWVFAAAATDIEYTLTVTDTQTDESRTYGNALGSPAPAVVDTVAFASCP
ncbi:hypothetical protein HQ535_02650 [bacterium]|nr:hypothetical protein [bacterium]